MTDATRESILDLIYKAMCEVKSLQVKYDQTLNVRIAVQRKADEAHAELCVAKNELDQAMAALAGIIPERLK